MDMFGSTKEFTWGGVISKTNEEINWNPIDEEDDEQEEMLLNHCLFLKQAVLGESAVEGERNIVEVETVDWNNKKICQPIFSLKLGLNENCSLDLTLLPPVKMRLLSGTGPVHITGTHAMEVEEDEDYMLNGDTTEEDVSDVKASPDLKSKKRPASAIKGSAKKRKVETNGTDEDEDEDEEDEEDDDEEEGEDEEDGEEDDEDEEDEDEEEDENEDEDEDEESMEEDDTEESSPEKTKKGKKGKQNGVASKKTGKKGKGKKMTVEEIKKELTQGSIKPKKEDKFTNLVKSKYNLTDAKKLQDLWTWFKTSQLAK